jgi:hypothetical protein
VLVEGAVRSVSVVVVDVVGDEAFELVLVPDDGPVQEFAAKCADPAFRETVGDGGSDRGLQNLHVLGSEDFVESRGELAATIADERSGIGQVVGVAYGQVACLLGVGAEYSAVIR